MEVPYKSKDMLLSCAMMFSLFPCRRMLLAALARRQRGPRMWCKPRSTKWWKGVTTALYGDRWWKENLRMTRDTFEIVCNELRPHIERQVTRFRQPVSMEARVAVTIWRLGTNIEHRTIAALFGLRGSTVCEIVPDTDLPTHPHFAGVTRIL